MGSSTDISLRDFQQLIREMYLDKDLARGVDGTFMWLVEEVGELAAALRQGTETELSAEFADVLAWLTTIANAKGVDLSQAVMEKYGSGCPGCGRLVCRCDEAEKRLSAVIVARVRAISDKLSETSETVIDRYRSSFAARDAAEGYGRDR